jgi:hypothetical protein
VTELGRSPRWTLMKADDRLYCEFVYLERGGIDVELQTAQGRPYATYNATTMDAARDIAAALQRHLFDQGWSELA